MNSKSNIILKKDIGIGLKPKRKTIPINLNSNPTPGKFLISNQVNPITSSYLSMGQKIQISKNIKNSKIIHVNTNSAKNYYTINNKDIKQTNGITTNSIINNYRTNDISNNNGISINNNYNIKNNYSQQQIEDNNGLSKIMMNRYKNLNINSKHGKNISSITNSLLPNDLLINGYQTSKNNNSNYINNNKSKNKIVSTNSKNNLSRIRQTYSTRPNFLDSKNKTKKVPMKSKIRQYKYQYKNNKGVSTSFSKVHVTKNNYLYNYQSNNQRNIYSHEKRDGINNITNENNHDNFMNINNNIYETKNKHFRHNTASFDNKDIFNIFYNQNVSDKNINSTNINYSNNNNKIINNNRCINKVSDFNNNDYYINKNNPNNLKKVGNNGSSNQYIKGKIGDIKIYVNEKKINQKEKYNSHNQNLNQNNYNENPFNENIYNKYHTKNISKNNSNNNINNNNIYHSKISHSINNGNNAVSGIRKISVKLKDKNNNNGNNPQNKIIHKHIPIQKKQGNNNNIIPSQRNNIKINLSKFLQDVKIKQNNKLVGRKALSIKRLPKENNSDFSLSQLNEKFAQKILKNNEEGNDENDNNNLLNHKPNINQTIQEEIKEKVIINKNVSQDQYINNNNYNLDNNNFLIDTNYISNIQNKADGNRISSVPTNTSKDRNIKNNYNNNNYYLKENYNSNASTNNNNCYGNNKNDYSMDNNKTNLTNENRNVNKCDKNVYLKNKEKITNLNIKENDNSNLNNKKILNKNTKNEKNINTNGNSNNNKNQFNISYENNIHIPKKNNIHNNNHDDNNVIDDDNNKKIIDNNIINNLFDEDNLSDLPEDYDDQFNDLYSIINKMNFGNVLICVEGYFTPEGRTYKKYKEKFDKFYDKLYAKKGSSFANSNNKPKKIMEGVSLTSNAKTCSSSSKKNINPMYNDLNIVKDLNNY